jgi:hypothetical protein
LQRERRETLRARALIGPKLAAALFARGLAENSGGLFARRVDDGAIRPTTPARPPANRGTSKSTRRCAHPLRAYHRSNTDDDGTSHRHSFPHWLSSSTAARGGESRTVLQSYYYPYRPVRLA